MKGSQKRRLRRLLTGGAFTVMIVAGMPVMAQDAPLPDADSDGEEVIVRGIRASIQASIDAKRNADSVVDVVSAEDIGKFANENVAEALQRVPGVQIDREGGEGRFVSIRGLGPSFNRTTINGRTAVSIGNNGTTNNRAFNFDSLATEFISRITVYKTPTADLDEGGLGGIIDIRTAKPLDRRIGRGKEATGGDVTAIGIEGSYADLAREYDPRVSVLASRRLTDNLGVLMSVAWNRRHLREDSAEIPAGAFVTVGGQAGAFRPTNIRQSLNREVRDRVGANIALQWNPDAWRFSLDYLYSLFEQDSDRDLLQAQPAAATVVGASQVVNSGGTLVERFTSNNATLGTFNQRNYNRTDTHIIGLNAARDFGPWTISADGSFATALYRARLDSYLANFRRNLTIDLSGAVPFVATNLPITNVDVPANQFISYLAQVNLTRTKETEKAGQIDVKRDLDSPIVSGFEFGGKYRARATDVVFNVYQMQDAALRAAATAAGGISLVPDTRPFPVDDFLGDYDVANRQFVGIDTPALFARLQPVFARIFPGGFETSTPDTARSFGVREDVLSGYAKINLKGYFGNIGYRGNVGVRIASTDSVAEGFVFNPSAAVYLPTSQNNSYFDWLPSANLALDIGPNLLIRLGAAKVITRPDLVDLSPTIIVQNLANGVARAGDPNLQPFRAKQYDLSFEYYPFNGKASVAVGLFYKDISSFTEVRITRETIPGFTAAVNGGQFDVIRPTNNGDGASVKGVEFAAQLPFAMFTRALDGFGLNANVTLIDSKTSGVDPNTGVALGVTGVAKTNYNLVGYFEQGGFGVRASYTYRSAFLAVRTSTQTGGAEFTEPYGTLDANISYDVTKSVSINAQAVNILGEDTRRYSGRPEIFRALINTDRRFVAGVRARF